MRFTVNLGYLLWQALQLIGGREVNAGNNFLESLELQGTLQPCLEFFSTPGQRLLMKAGARTILGTSNLEGLAIYCFLHSHPLRCNTCVNQQMFCRWTVLVTQLHVQHRLCHKTLIFRSAP